MSATLGKNLVLEVNPADAGLFEDLHGPGGVVGFSETGVRIGDDGDRGHARDVLRVRFRLGERHYPDIRDAAGAIGEDGPGQVHGVEAKGFDQAGA